MKQPIEPKKEDCCNSGCNPCIFDVYEKQLRLYKSHIEIGENSSLLNENAISQLEYTPFKVIKNIDMCPQHRLLFFGQDILVAGSKQVLWRPGEHLLVKYSFKEQSCTRAYTPIKLESYGEENYDFAIIIKRYVNGLVSNYLCNLNVGEITLWRGPYGHYQMDSAYSRIVMIAQGTGVAPFYSIINHILNDEENMTKINLMYCCKCINTILLRDELYRFKSYWNFEYVIYVSEEVDNTTRKYQEPISTRRLTFENMLNLKPFTKKDQFLLCGSDEFTKHYHAWLLEQDVKIESIVIF